MRQGHLACCLLLVGLIANVLTSRASAQTVHLLFKVNDKDVSVDRFEATVYKVNSSEKIGDLMATGHEMAIPTGLKLPAKFDVVLAFHWYRLTIYDIGSTQMKGSWKIDVTDPIKRQTGGKHRLIQQFIVRFDPGDAEGTYRLFEVYDD